MALSSHSSLVFKVRRHEPEFITPAKPTPCELKPLSDIDDQEGFRFHVPVLQFYHNDVSMEGLDPVDIIRKAIANVLVFYYPFAGRIKEGPERKLIVDCTGEGVMFIEADADIRLDQFGNAIQPPYPWLEEVLYDVPGSGGVIDCPLLLIQVTRLLCGGFIFGIRLNHTMCDAFGIVQFMFAVGEMARGATTLTVQPTWQRELLNARETPTVTCEHREYDVVPDTKNTLIPLDDMVHRSFFFGTREMAALKKHLPPHFRSCSIIQILTACLWRCRTIAIQPDPEEIVRVILAVDARWNIRPPLPKGFYGNAAVLPAALATAEKLCQNPVSYALELIMKAKSTVTEEYMRSVADLMVIKGRPHFTTVRTFVVSDVRRLGSQEVDFGWGKAFYVAPAKAGVGNIPGSSYFVTQSSSSITGEDGALVLMCLPPEAMEIFVVQIQRMIEEPRDGILYSRELGLTPNSLSHQHMCGRTSKEFCDFPHV